MSDYRAEVSNYDPTDTPLALRLSEGLGPHSAEARKSRRRNRVSASCGKVERGTGEDRKATGAQCPRVRLVLGYVIGIGESPRRRKPLRRYPV